MREPTSLRRPRTAPRTNPFAVFGWGILSVVLGSVVELVAVGYFHLKDKLQDATLDGKPDWIPSLVTIEIGIGVLACLHGLWILRMRRKSAKDPVPWGRDASWSSSWWRSRLRSTPKVSKRP
jgi:hypothetical protein